MNCPFVVLSLRRICLFVLTSSHRPQFCICCWKLCRTAGLWLEHATSFCSSFGETTSWKRSPRSKPDAYASATPSVGGPYERDCVSCTATDSSFQACHPRLQDQRGARCAVFPAEIVVHSPQGMAPPQSHIFAIDIHDA